MLRKSFVGAIVAGVAALLTPTQVHAWGAAHVGYTHVGPSGAYHYGRSAAVGPYGAYSGGHAGAYGYGGGAYHSGEAYHYNTGYGGAYHYNTGYGEAYHYGTMPGYGYGYSGGVYRR
ncbi:MAG: hypothetical protein JWO38_6890 [Gemmataceae bacterium]|nr:hypothetical protein [Gemmataceae bacterium]